MRHAVDDLIEDAEGWITAVCKCGWQQGPFVDREDAIDALMDHAASVKS